VICNLFQRASDHVWELLSFASKNGVQLGEETITDLLVLYLKFRLQGSSKEIVNGFNRHQEGRNGADWELWLYGSNKKTLGLRIQSKILFNASARYKSLHYPPHKTKVPQIDRLKIDAARVGAIPIYCLYSFWEQAPVTLPRLQCSGCNYQYRQPWGLGMLSVDKVIALKSTTEDSLTKVISHVVPFECMFCTRKTHGVSDIENVSAYLNENGFTGDSVVGDLLPGYVQILLESGSRNGFSEEIQLDVDDENLGRVVLLRGL
jgi:hypothetical protein